MKAKRREAWADYFIYLAKEMGLADWRIRLSAETPQEAFKVDNNVAACIKCIYAKKVAIIYLYAEWEDEEPEDQRNHAVHELVHAHFEQADEYVRQLTLTHLSSRDAEWHHSTFGYLMEFGVDALAKVLAPHLYLPGSIITDLRKVAASAK